MADTLPPVVIELKLQTEQMQAQLKNVTSQLEALGNKAKTSAGGFDSLKSSALGIAGAVGGFVVFQKVFSTGIQEAKDYSAGVAQLEAGIKSTGNVANVTVKSMTDLANAIQKTSGQTDDSIIKTEQLLLTFTSIRNVGVDKIFDQATQAAADMAAKLGGDASQQAILLGKALNDPVQGLTALRRVGVSFTDAQMKSIKAMQESGNIMGAQKAILKELSVEFGGAADAAGNSLAGQLDKAKRSFEDMAQSVVEAFVPVIAQASEWFQKFMEVLKPFAPAIVVIVGAFAAYKLAMMGAMAAQALYNGVMALSTIATQGFTLALASTGIGAIIIAVGLLTAALIGLNTAAGTAGGAPSKAAIAAGEAAKKKAEEAYAKRVAAAGSSPMARRAASVGGAASQANVAYNKAVAAVTKAEQEAQAEKLAKMQADAEKAAANIGKGGAAPAAKTAVSTAAQQMAAAIAKFRQATLVEQNKYQTDSQAALKDHQTKVGQIIADGSSKLKDIIAKSKALLTDAFKSATAFDVGSMFKDAEMNVGGLLTMVKDKLSGAKKLADDAAKLAGLGYSQSFIQSIIAQGPQLGDAMVQQLLTAGPEQTKQLQDQLAALDQVSAHGVDALAEQINQNGNLATEELKNQFVTAQQDLVKALSDENDAYSASVKKLVNDYEVAMAKLQVTRDKAMIKALQVGGVTKTEKKKIAALEADIAAENKIIAAGGTTVNVVANTNASPAQIAQDVVNAIKFNAPVSVGA